MRGYRSNWDIEKSLAAVREVKIEGRPAQDSKDGGRESIIIN